MTNAQRFQIILRHTAAHYEIPAEDLLGRRRFARVAWARMVAVELTFHFCYDVTACEISTWFNQKKSSVFHTEKAVRDRLSCPGEERTRESYHALKTKLIATLGTPERARRRGQGVHYP